MYKVSVGPRSFCTLLTVLTAVSCAPINPPADQVSGIVEEDAIYPVPPPPVGAVMCPASVTRSKPGWFGPIGGYLPLDRHLLDVPPGVLQQSVRFVLREPAADYVVIEVLPDNQQFQGRVVRLTVSAVRCDEPPSGPLKLLRWNPRTEQWDPVVSQKLLNEGEAAVTAELDHLSKYALATGS